MKKNTGFSLLEAMVAVAIIAILAAMAIPSYMTKIVREQIEKAMPLVAETAQPAVTIAWKTEQIFPANNAAAQLPVPEKIVNNFIQSVTVENGAIHMTFGNRAHSAIKGKVLTVRPAVVEDSPIVPITWVCGFATAPGQMVAKGSNRTTVDTQYLPALCRAPAKQ